MCGRYSQSIQWELLQQRFRLLMVEKLQPRYNIAPGQEAVVILTEENNVLKMMRWGLVPSWSKDENIGYKMINARSETAAQKPSFRKSFISRRCIIPADGFYEWKKEEGSKTKIPMRFTLQSEEPFAFAGLWDQWKNQDGEPLDTYTILTTEANEFIKEFHHRMPVILHSKDEQQWLDPSNQNIESLQKLLIPYPAKEMKGYRVSSLINSPKNERAECILPIEENVEEPEQGLLF